MLAHFGAKVCLLEQYNTEVQQSRIYTVLFYMKVLQLAASAGITGFDSPATKPTYVLAQRNLWCLLFSHRDA